jgi:ketosteroid isomerase-like protein
MEQNSLTSQAPAPETRAEPPERVIRAFAGALLGGDATAAAAYFAPGSQLLTPDGTEVSGRAQITAVLSQITDSSQRLSIMTGRIVIAGDVALATQRWSISSASEGVEPFERNFTATFVLQHEGERWQVLIAAPWR